MEKSREDGSEDTNGILSGLKELMHNKYGDIILQSCSKRLNVCRLMPDQAHKKLSQREVS